MVLILFIISLAYAEFSDRLKRLDNTQADEENNDGEGEDNDNEAPNYEDPRNFYGPPKKTATPQQNKKKAIRNMG